MLVDLHIHTTATPHHSSWDPAALVAAAVQSGIQLIAATDHNTTAGVAALQQAARSSGVRVVSGVEIDSGFGGKLWHTLIYGVAPACTELLDLCRAVFVRNQADATALQTTLLEMGFHLAGLHALGRPANVADVATVLARLNTLPDRVPDEDDESAGMRYILTALPGSYRPPGVDQLIEVAHRHGGLAVLAHPGRSKGAYAIPATAADVAHMASAGLDGIEVLYPTHTPAQRDFYAALARQYGLCMSGGSDSHRPQQPLARWPADQLDIVERLGAGKGRV